jgi:transposase-like protein
MITQALHCPHCHRTDSVRHGKTPQGKQRYRCRETSCQGCTFLLDYSYPGQSPHIKEQMVEMAMNASGIRDTARVLHVSPTTVINELKKRRRSCTR